MLVWARLWVIMIGEWSDERYGTVCQIVPREKGSKGDFWRGSGLGPLGWLSCGGGGIV